MTEHWIELDRVETDTVQALIEEWVRLAGAQEEHLSEAHCDRLIVLRDVLRKLGGDLAFPGEEKSNRKTPPL